MKHPWIAFCTAVCLLLPGAAVFAPLTETVVSAEGKEYGIFTYTLNGETSFTEPFVPTYAKIESCSADAVEAVIPEEIEGLPVTSIYYQAFDKCFQLESLTLPASLDYLSNLTHCTNLKSLTVLNPDCTISLSEDFDGTIYGYDNSAAHIYAVWHQLPFVSLGEGPESSRKVCGGAEYEITTANTVNIIGPGSVTEEIVIPSEIEGLPVTEIGAWAFSDWPVLTSLTLPESLKVIHSSFTNCTNLRSVTLPEGVEEIGQMSFKGCSSLTSVTLPKGLTEIGNDMFDGCSALEEIAIPDSVTNIGSYAFSGCSALEKITLPDSVTSIEENAFSGCTSLTEITLPAGLTSIGQSAFADCTALTAVRMSERGSSADEAVCGGEAFSGCTALTSVTLPAGLKNIPEKIFDGCTALTAFTVSDSVKELAPYAFSGSSITSVSIPDGVTSLDMAFKGAAYLKEIRVSDGNASYSDQDGILFSKDGTSLYFYPAAKAGSYTVPDSVTNIRREAFYQSQLTSVILPESVLSVGQGAFSECAFLESLTVFNPACILTPGTGGSVLISNGTDDNAESYYHGIICGQADSTAQAYANKHGLTFVQIGSEPDGDVSGDGVLSVSDVVLLQKWLLSAPDAESDNWPAADLNLDGELDVFDLALMKRSLLDR